jgi:hypothetical protein
LLQERDVEPFHKDGVVAVPAKVPPLLVRLSETIKTCDACNKMTYIRRCYPLAVSRNPRGQLLPLAVVISDVCPRQNEETHLGIIVPLADPSLGRPVAVFCIRLLDLSGFERRLGGVDCLAPVGRAVGEPALPEGITHAAVPPETRREPRDFWGCFLVLPEPVSSMRRKESWENG